MKIRITDGGRLAFIYNDKLAALLTLGAATVRRVSHVEPAPGGGWTADMSPINGPVLGPFNLRQTALDAEVEYLKTTHGL